MIIWRCLLKRLALGTLPQSFGTSGNDVSSGYAGDNRTSERQTLIYLLIINLILLQI